VVDDNDPFAVNKQANDRLFALHSGQRVDLFDQPETQLIANRNTGK
jgi:hypothetical protein